MEAKCIRPIGIKVDCLFVSTSDALAVAHVEAIHYHDLVSAFQRAGGNKQIEGK